MLLVVTVELWDRAHPLMALAFTACAGLALWPRVARAGTAACAAVLAVDFAQAFPAAANHQYLQLILLGLLAFLRREDAEEGALLDLGLRWLLPIGLFHAGWQKLLHGLYFEGELLLWAISQTERFALVLGPLLPAGELARLQAITIAEGAGPFRVDSLLFAVVSNVAYLGELVLPPLLLWPPTRRLAVVATLAYFVAVEAAARELFFGALMAGLALLWWPGALQRSFPVLALGLAYLAAMVFGLLPRWFFT